jgi:hypothetical protein
MIVLYVFLSLLALVFLILLIDVSFVFELKEEVKIRIKILFVSFDAEKLVARFSEKHELPEESEQPKKKTSPSIETLILRIKYITRLVRALIHEFCRYAKLKICFAYIKVATDDAAQTATAYALVSGAVYSLVEFLSYNLKTEKSYKKIKIFPDFTSSEFQAKMKIVLKIKPIHILLAAMHLLPLVQKRKVGTK